MQIRTTRERLLATTIICGAAMAIAAPAFAQDAVQEVVVTGSRIPQPNLTSASPLTTVSSQELKLQGTTNVESLLNDLPQVVATQTSQVSNGSNGTATVSLRNLGAARTLVLVDGKRIQPGDPAGGSAADLNDIPAALIDRIDVVSGGASSIYGSDAISGVVNFIMKKNFQGLRLDAQTSFANHENDNAQADATLALKGLPKPGSVTDGFIYDVTAVIGANLPDDKGNVTAYASYRHLDPVLEGTRDFADCGIATSGATNNTHVCAGSSNTAFGRFDNLGAINPATGRGTTVRALGPGGTFIPYTSALAYNFNPLNFMQREDDTYHAGYFAHYDLSKSLEVYSDFMFSDDQTNAQIAPSGFFRSSGPNLATGYTFNCSNPLITAAELPLLCPNPGQVTTTQSIGYRFASEPRNDDLRHTSYKIDIGVRGDLAQGWHYDAYLQYGTTILEDTTTGYASETKLQNALNVVSVNGVNKCVTNDPACVPLNIFLPSGQGFTKAALAYVLVPGFTVGQDVEQVASASITGDLGQYGAKSPWASEGIGVALGTEYRREQTSETFDEEKVAGDLSGGNGASPPAAGAFDVYELFGEARIPIASDKPFIKDLTADVAYRFSDYSTAGKTDTYSAELHYSPISDLAFRFSYNRAVRAPAAVELFVPQSVGLAGYSDPCGGAINPATGKVTGGFTQAQCVNTGLAAALYGLVPSTASAQSSVLTGGNTNLQPETADTYSVGAVFTPTFIRGFSATIDYFNINIQNVIDSGSSPQTILSFCAAGVTSYCGFIHRDQQGGLESASGYIVQTAVNSGSLQTRGVDFTANYRFRFADIPMVPYVSMIPGSLTFALVGTYTEDLTFQPGVGQGHYNCVGYYGITCGVPQPHWKGQLRTTWVTPWNASISLNWRYTGAVKADINQADPFLGFGGGFYDNADARIGDYNYFDLAGTYRFRDRYTFRAGINNLLDKDPPIIDANSFGLSSPPFGNANTFPGVYDSLGRTIFVGVTADF